MLSHSLCHTLSFSATVSLTSSFPLPLFLSLFSGEDDWNAVITECSSLAAKWEQLSGYLGLSFRLIEEIKGNHPNNNSACWNKALQYWIQQNYNTENSGLPSWRTLLGAVVKEDKLLFKELAPKHQGT